MRTKVAIERLERAEVLSLDTVTHAYLESAAVRMYKSAWWGTVDPEDNGLRGEVTRCHKRYATNECAGETPWR